MRIILYALIGIVLYRPVLGLMSDERTVYTVVDRHKEGEVSAQDARRYLPVNPVHYKLVNGVITQKIAGMVSDHSNLDCDVWDLDNWECSNREYGSTYHVGFRDGKYFNASTPPPFNGAEFEVGFLRYWYETCKWDIASSAARGAVICGIRFFSIE